MSDIISGTYHEVELRDGSIGNYEVAQRYYLGLCHLLSTGYFNKLCGDILDDPKAPLEREHKAILAEIGLAWMPEGHHEAVLLKPEDEIKDFVCLAVRQRPLNRIFAAMACVEPHYHLVSPFKKPSEKLHEVAEENRKKIVVADWAGSDITQFPGARLYIT